MSQTPLENCFKCMMDTFHKYSIQHQHYDTLNRGELKRLIEEQLCNLIKKCKDNKTVEEIFKSLDKDKSGDISFEECMVLMTKMMIIYHDNFHKDSGHGHGHSHDQGQGHGHSH